MPQISRPTPHRPPRVAARAPARNGAAESVVDRIRPIGFAADDPLSILVYGRSATGKTTFWATFPGPILALICSGGLRPGELRSVDTAENRGKISQVVLHNTNDFRLVLEHVAATGGYRTLVLDHVSGFQDLVLKEILGLEELPAQKSWGMASQQLYGQMTGAAKDLIRKMLNLNCNVVIVGQERQSKDDGDSDIIMPTVGVAVTPSFAGWLNPSCDYVVQTFLRPKVERVVKKVKVAGKDKEIVTERRLPGVEYCMRTEAHDIYQTKFRVPKGRPLPDCVVNPTYEKIVALIRG